MIFWTSSETSEDVVKQFASISMNAEKYINALLSKAKLSPSLDGWTWAFIGIIISPELGINYPERIQRSLKRKTFEFRIKIDHDLFLKGSRLIKIELFFAQLRRCVDLLGKWNVSSSDREVIHGILKNTFDALISE